MKARFCLATLLGGALVSLVWVSSPVKASTFLEGLELLDALNKPASPPACPDELPRENPEKKATPGSCYEDASGSEWAEKYRRFKALPLMARELAEKLYWSMRASGAITGERAQKVTDADVQEAFFRMNGLENPLADDPPEVHTLLWERIRPEVIPALEIIKRDQNLLESRVEERARVYETLVETGEVTGEALLELQQARHEEAQFALRCEPLLLTSDLIASVTETLLWGHTSYSAKPIAAGIKRLQSAILDIRRFHWRVETVLGSGPIAPIEVKGWIQHKTWLEINRVSPELAKRFSEVMNRGIMVGPKGQQGIVEIAKTEKFYSQGYRYKLKVLGKFGDYRVYGRVDPKTGRIIYDKFGKHADFNTFIPSRFPVFARAGAFEF